MTRVDDLWTMAHDLYAHARACADPVTKRKLMTEADGFLNKANEIRLRTSVIKAEYPDTGTGSMAGIRPPRRASR
jgi:hypothetical protein